MSKEEITRVLHDAGLRMPEDERDTLTEGITILETVVARLDDRPLTESPAQPRGKRP
ncbi:MAG: hypothetical protein RID42_11260 [Alphaproteobacteria bacterium]